MMNNFVMLKQNFLAGDSEPMLCDTLRLYKNIQDEQWKISIDQLKFSKCKLTLYFNSYIFGLQLKNLA